MNIILTGFYGEGNLGDEAILAAILENLPNNITPIITAGKTKNPALNHKNLKLIKRRKGLALPIFMKNAAKCQWAIFSGGILQDWSLDGVMFFATRIYTAAMMGCKPVLWGAGLGPLRHPLTRAITARALKHVKIAWLRDEPSMKLFKELTGKEAKLGTDWSWHFQPPKTRDKKTNQYLVNLRPWAHELPELETLKKQNWSQPNQQLLGIAARGEDKKAISELFKSLPISQPKTFLELLETCSNATQGVAMRYHVALAMIRSGLDFKCVPYDEKVLQVKEGLKHRKKFLSDNQNRYKKMQNAFKEMFKQ